MQSQHPTSTDTAKIELRQVLGYLLAMAGLKTTKVFEEMVEQAMNLRRVEYTILEMLSAEPSLKAHQIARRLSFTRASTSAWIDKMTTKGLIECSRDHTDKRSIHLKISTHGRSVLVSARQAILKGEKTAMAKLTPAEQAMLKELLIKFTF